MGFMSWFGGGPLSTEKIAKISKLACNPFAQPDVRVGEMSRLLDEGTPQAIAAVLKRFAANASGPTADEEEKSWLEERLVDFGAGAILPLHTFIRSEQQLTYALQALHRLAGEEDSIKFLIGVLDDYGPDDHRGAEPKLQIVWQLAESLDNPNVLPALIPFLQDHSDDVRCAVMDLLARYHTAHDGLPEQVRTDASTAFGIMISDDTPPRIQTRAADFLANHQWKVGTVTLAPYLSEQYFVDKKQFLRRRSSAR